MESVRADSPTSPGPQAATPSQPGAPARPALTQDDWQQLMATRAAAMKANPQLTAKSQELGMKMRAFQEKLKAAMIQEDPKVAPMLDQLEHKQPTPPVQQTRPFSSHISFPPQSSSK